MLSISPYKNQNTYCENVIINKKKYSIEMNLIRKKYKSLVKTYNTFKFDHKTKNKDWTTTINKLHEKMFSIFYDNNNVDKWPLIIVNETYHERIKINKNLEKFMNELDLIKTLSSSNLIKKYQID